MLHCKSLWNVILRIWFSFPSTKLAKWITILSYQLTLTQVSLPWLIKWSVYRIFCEILYVMMLVFCATVTRQTSKKSKW
jgi:hypothetical protein